MLQKTVKTPAQERREQEQGAIAVSSGAAAQHNLRNIGLIIGREYKSRVKARSFIITTVIFLVIVFLAAFIPTIVQLINSRTTSQASAVVQQSQITQSTSAIAAGFVLAFAGVILIFVYVSIYANIVASGVAEEKSNRLMEILVSAATPFQLLAGKIVGIGTACLTQMGCVVVVGIAALLLQTPLQTALFGASTGNFTQYLTGVSIPFYLLFLLYVLLAFLLYATLYAGLGAMVKRQEEIQSAVILPQMLMVSGYLLFFLTVSSPNATLPKVLSYIPFWTPGLMLMRLAVGTVAWWEIVVTITLMLVTILACTWFAARLYRYGILMYGQRPGLGRMIKLAFGR